MTNNFTDLKIGDKVTVHCNKKHKEWQNVSDQQIEKMFPQTHILTEVRIGPSAKLIGRMSNGFEYVLDTGAQHNSHLTYIEKVH